MAKNEFLPFGTAANANVIPNADYLALPARSSGFSSGVAKSEQLNTVWRQASVIASVVAQFIADNSGQDVLDDGNVTTLKNSLEQALSAQATGRLLNVRTFTSSGTYTPTPGTKSIIAEGVGGGGGAGGAPFTSSGYYTGTGGGGAGGYFKTRITNIPASISVTVGKGGAGGLGGSAGNVTDGADGGQTYLGSYAQASGGKGSTASSSPQNTGVSYRFGSGFGGFATNGAILNCNGGDGTASIVISVGSGLSGTGGASYFSSGGSPTPFNSSGVSGKYGSGGGGVVSMSNPSTVCNGGNGGDGIVVIYEYA